MTCIVGLVSDGDVWMGGDSAGVAGSFTTARKDPKVFVKGDFIFGFTTSFRMGQLLAHKFDPPKRHADQDVYAYMVTSFIDALRTCFKEAGYASKNNDVESAGTFLVGYAGRLFEVESDYQVGEGVLPYAACGSGIEVALGAMFVSGHVKPRQRIEAALAAAENFCTGVRAPFLVERLSARKEAVPS